MASAVTVNQLASRLAIKNVYHIPASTGAVVASIDGGTTKNYLDMRDFENFGVSVVNAVSTSASGPTLIEIVAAEDTAGTNVQVITTSGTIASVTAGDNMWVECSAAQIKEVADSSGKKLRYVTARLTTSNSSDKQAVTMIRANGKFPADKLTNYPGP